jgi:AcrR family transcriptional regulator
MQEDQEKQILAAALSRFVKQGVAKTTLEDVADEAGVKLGVVRGYFNDHDQLLRELVTTTTDPLVAAISLISEDIKDPREWLRQSLRLYDRLMHENPLYVQLMKQIMLDEPDTLSVIYDVSYVPSEFYERLQKYADAGKFRITDVFLLGMFIDSMLFFPHMLAPMLDRYLPDESPEDFQERKFEAMIDILENGLFSNQAASS